MTSSTAASIGGSLVSAGVSKLLGGKKKGKEFNQDAGGYTIKINKYGDQSIKTSPERKALVNSLTGKSNQYSSDIKGLIPGVTSSYQSAIDEVNKVLPGLSAGYGDITKARVNTIQNEGRKSSSDLRGDLARRRVIGSSFGNDALSRDKAEFAQKEADARAKSYLEELDKNTELVGKRLQYQISQINDTNSLLASAYDASIAADKYQLEEMNSQLAALQAVSGSAQNLAQLNAQLEANKASSVSSIAGGFGNLVSSWLQPSSSSGALPTSEQLLNYGVLK